MTATNIRTIEENAENKLSERIVQGSVCTNRSDWWPKPVRLVAKTGQTGLHGLHGTVTGPT